MSLPRRVVLLRHGRTAHNATGRIQGQLDVDLDDVGRGEPVWYLVPDGVVQYIAKHGLYGDAVADLPLREST